MADARHAPIDKSLKVREETQAHRESPTIIARNEHDHFSGEMYVWVPGERIQGVFEKSGWKLEQSAEGEPLATPFGPAEPDPKAFNLTKAPTGSELQDILVAKLRADHQATMSVTPRAMVDTPMKP